jgi:hypothetical protein
MICIIREVSHEFWYFLPIIVVTRSRSSRKEFRRAPPIQRIHIIMYTHYIYIYNIYFFLYTHLRVRRLTRKKTPQTNRPKTPKRKE